MTAPILFGPNGKPVSSVNTSLYPSTRNNPRSVRQRPILNRDMRRNVGSSLRKELVNNSRLLYGRLGNLGTAITDKNWWAFGDAFDPHYTGTNATWGQVATEFLRDQFFPNCDRLGRYDYKTCLYLSGIAWDRDGDDLMLLTEDDNGSGFPKLEFIPATRIGSGGMVTDADNRLKDGRYEGLRIFDGIIFDDSGKPVAARILGEDPNDKESFQDYSLGFGGNADLAYLPEWTDQGRGIPLVGRCSGDWMDIEDTTEFLKRGIKRASAVGLIEKNAEGEAVQNEVSEEVDVTLADGTQTTLQYDEVEGGEIYYLRANGGEEIQGLKYETPHPNVEAFISRIERAAIRNVGWAYELIYLNESGKAATRLVCDLANNSIWKQQKLGLRRTWRACRYALAKGQKHGFIPKNPDPKDAYFSWDFGLPAEICVDQGNDQQADRENLKIGTTNKKIIAQKRGYHWREIARQRKEEIIANAADADEIVAKTSGKVSFDKALEMLEQRAANPVSQAPKPAGPPAAAPAKGK